jgi:hypothetical protein
VIEIRSPTQSLGQGEVGSINFSAAEDFSVQEEDPELFEDEGTVPRICASWSDKATVCAVEKTIGRNGGMLRFPKSLLLPFALPASGAKIGSFDSRIRRRWFRR